MSEEKTIKIHIINATFKRNHDIVGGMDPYIIFEIGNQKFRTKTIRNGGKTPAFFQTFTFNITDEDTIKFSAYDEDTTYDDFIGSAEVSISCIANLDDSTELPLYKNEKEEGSVHFVLTTTMK